MPLPSSSLSRALFIKMIWGGRPCLCQPDATTPQKVATFFSSFKSLIQISSSSSSCTIYRWEQLTISFSTAHFLHFLADSTRSFNQSLRRFQGPVITKVFSWYFQTLETTGQGCLNCCLQLFTGKGIFREDSDVPCSTLKLLNERCKWGSHQVAGNASTRH